MNVLNAVEPATLKHLSDDALLKLAGQLLEVQSHDRQENQLRYYKPVSPLARQVHTSTCKTLGIGGGNGSSKTDSALAELVIRATGQIPLSLRDDYPREKLRGPVACRVVCESLTTTLVPIILPKLQYYKWSGVDRPGGVRGHWGWIPKSCLIKGDWQKSWDDRRRILRLLYRNPDKPDRIEGESLIQFMSYDQDPSDFASGDFHFILHDEPPRYDIWRENRARVMRVDGTLMLAMTWPDDPSIPVDWIFDEIYEKAQAGDPSVQWLTLYTTDNPNLNQNAVGERAKQMSVSERQARIYGAPIRLGNRVHPTFTDQVRYWCFGCKEMAVRDESGTCSLCHNRVVAFTHVAPAKVEPTHPVVMLLDPHPRKAHCLSWVQIDPNDDWHTVHELESAEGPVELWQQVQEIEASYGWNQVTRLMDPNMGKSPSDTTRETTWQDAFAQVGLVCDLADDGEAGRKGVDNMLAVDEQLERPRWAIDPRCKTTIYQMRRYLWDDFKRQAERDQKQRPKDRHSDFPTLYKYLANSQPTFRTLKMVGQVYKRTRPQESGYRMMAHA